MDWIILAVSMLSCLFGSVIKKHCGDKFVNKAVMIHFFNAVISLVSAVSLLVISGGFSASPFTIMLGIVFGIITAVQYVFCLKSYEIGPFSYTAVIISLSTIIPTLSGCIIWGEEISGIQIVGIVLMMLCFVFSVDFSEGRSRASLLWLVYVFITFVTTGLIGVMQKWHQSTEYSGELDGFLIVAFIVAFIYALVNFIFRMKSVDNEVKKSVRAEMSVMLVILMIIAGVCAAANNKMNLYLSGVMDTAVFFPVVNGGGLVLSTIASLVIFREKPNLQKWIGIIMGIVAVICLCI